MHERMLPFTDWAARVEGCEGWFLGTSLSDKSVARRDLEKAGYQVHEIRVLGTGQARRPPRVVGHPPNGMTAYWARNANWAFDAAAQCWRAPGEAATAPNSESGWCNNVATAFGKPCVGWMDWVIGAAGRSAVISCSDVFDPIVDLLHFLEQIVQGGTPRLSIDEEGHVVQRHVLPAPGPADTEAHGHLPEPVRLALLSSHEEAVLLDIVVPRRAFASDVYRAWITALRQHRRAFTTEWFGRSLPDDAADGDPAATATENDFGRVRSPALDRLLKETDG